MIEYIILKRHYKNPKNVFENHLKKIELLNVIKSYESLELGFGRFSFRKK